MSEEAKRRLDPGHGFFLWGSEDGLLRLQLYPENCREPYIIWMTPGQVLALIEDGANAARRCLKASL